MANKVLVTGASGYIALHVVDQLLKEGFRVVGTVRQLSDEKKIEPIRKLAVSKPDSLEIVEADLLDADAWNRAITNEISHVFHVASPLPPGHQTPNDELYVIKPAVEGTLNVLKASLNKNVKRVVVTSSGLCICGYNWEDRKYSEIDWPNVEDMKMAYGKSKVLAEKAAWNFVEEQKANNKDCFELAVVHPTLVLGPLLAPSTGASATRFLNVLNNQIDKIPNVYYPTCDVRDVAKAHLKAAFLPEENGHRHLITSSSQFIPMKQWVDELRKEFEPKGYTFPTEVEQGESKGQNAILDNTRMSSVLGIEATDFSSTIIDMAYSFINLGLVEKKF